MRRKTVATIEKILLRVAIYIRVSTDRQVKEGDSMRDQLATGQKYIDTHENMILVDTYIDDGISGQKLKRNDFQRLLDDIRQDGSSLHQPPIIHNIGFWYILSNPIARNSHKLHQTTIKPCLHITSNFPTFQVISGLPVEITDRHIWW